MKQTLDRRELLKLIGVTGAAPYVWGWSPHESSQAESENILIVVFDSLSAEDMELHGYPRQTMPNLSQFAERCYVYHNHYAGGPFTTPGTAALLTGTYPFTNRAVNVRGRILPSLAGRNMFALFDDYYRVAYSHNQLVNNLMAQFDEAINEMIPMQDLLLWDGVVSERLFAKDWPTFIRYFRYYANQLLLGGDWFGRLVEESERELLAPYREEYPQGMPTTEGVSFQLRDAFDHLLDNLNSYASPYLGYFHFYPPHYPYKSRAEFIDTFKDDGWKPVRKDAHMLHNYRPDERASYERVIIERQAYNDFQRDIDDEFGQWIDRLDAMGALENTWLIVTSDHGELFERGVWGHNAALLHEGVTHIPLLIHPPGGAERHDVYNLTSAVDVLPTLLTIAKKEMPDWIEGVPLPPFGVSEAGRSVFSIQSVETAFGQPFNKASWMIRQGDYKLMSYFGYQDLVGGRPFNEFYDLAQDGQELENLFYANNQAPVIRHLFEELVGVIERANEGS